MASSNRLFCTFRRVAYAAVVVPVALAVPAAALPDPPLRAARVSFLSGSVSLGPASDDEWNAATLNYPVTIGDRVWTDRTGRTEIQLGSSVVRLASSTSASVLNLDASIVQLRIAQGSL